MNENGTGWITVLISLWLYEASKKASVFSPSRKRAEPNRLARLVFGSRPMSGEGSNAHSPLPSVNGVLTEYGPGQPGAPGLPAFPNESSTIRLAGKVCDEVLSLLAATFQLRIAKSRWRPNSAPSF